MLPQLSYVVAQAGVDSRPPPTLPRLTKPFYANGDSTPSSNTSLEHTFTPPSYYMRPGTSPPILPLQSNTSTTAPVTATATSSAINTMTTTTTSAAASSSIYKSKKNSNTHHTNNNHYVKVAPSSSSLSSRSTSSSLDFNNVSPQHQHHHRYQHPRKSPAITTKSLYQNDYLSIEHTQQQHPYPPSSVAAYTQPPYASPNYPNHPSNDPWPHRIATPFVEPTKSSIPANYSYSASYLPYTTPPPLAPPPSALPSSTSSSSLSSSPSLSQLQQPSSSSHHLRLETPSSSSSSLDYQAISHRSLPPPPSSSSSSHLTSTKQQKHRYHHHYQQGQSISQAPSPLPLMQKGRSRGFEALASNSHSNDKNNNGRDGGHGDDDNNINDDDDDDDDASSRSSSSYYPYSHLYRHGMSTNGPVASNGYTTHRVERMKEWNQLLTWMDHEFWEQSEEIYQEKLAALQEELKCLQNDTHGTFRDLVSDLDLKREAVIADAEYFFKYQLQWMEQLYQEDTAVIEEEYNNERKQLHDVLLAVIDDRKKQVREEKDDSLNVKDLFNEAYSRVTNKRTLRKRPAETSRNDTRKRQARHATSHQIDSTKEDEELEEELVLMRSNIKGMSNGHHHHYQQQYQQQQQQQQR